MNVTFAVMAHPDRGSQAERLARELGGAPIAWAEPPWARPGNWVPIWRTRKRALLLAGDAPFHCVVQDDAVLAPRFVERVTDLVELGEHLYGLFFRKKRAYRHLNPLADQAIQRGSFTTAAGPVLGVGLVFPAAWIPDIIAFGDADPAYDGDDDRIRRWMRARSRDIVYPIPSLVDHRPGPSLIGNAEGRVAWRFGEAVA